MNSHRLLVLLSVFIFLPVLLSYSHESEARRLGGGKSFGSKPAYSQSATRDSAGSSQSSGASQGQAKNSALKQQLSQRGGLMGMLGGLALGGLLGALFFGGAFENLNFLDILIFAGIAFLLYRLFAAKAKKSPAQSYAAPGGVAEPAEQSRQESVEDYRLYQRQPHFSKDSFETDLMSDVGSGSRSGNQAGTSLEVSGQPAGFDQAAFVTFAENAYRTMQKAWDEGELAELRGMMSDRVFAEVQEQYQLRGDVIDKTEIFTIKSQLLDVSEKPQQIEASILFDVVMREEEGERPAQVREIWHFVRKTRGLNTSWLLDGIQQLEG